MEYTAQAVGRALSAGVRALDLEGQVFMRSQHFTEFYEGANDQDVHLHCARGVQYGRKHGNAVKQAKKAALMEYGWTLQTCSCSEKSARALGPN